MGGIFISYRREDTKPYARLLSEALVDRFGADQVFRDIDSMGPGVDFPKAIAEAVGGCDALLALIGKGWLTARREGQRRLDDPNDYVRMEIVAALERDTLVVPILIEDTRMPARTQLPGALGPLADRNARRLTDEGWDDEVNRLITALERILSTAAPTAVGPPPAGSASRIPAPPARTPHVPTTTFPAPSTPPTSWSPPPLGPPAGPAEPSRLRGDSAAPARIGGGHHRGVIVGMCALIVLVAAVALVVRLTHPGGDGSAAPATTTTAVPAPVTTRTTVPGTRTVVTFDPTVPADITISPTKGPSGTKVTVDGTGFLPGERVDVRFSTTIVGQPHANGAGAIHLIFPVPSSPFRGTQFDVVATGAQSANFAPAPFQLT